ncbi:MAG: hypothetical protein ACO289_02105 [Prochlorococcaceae cyanobacterium]
MKKLLAGLMAAAAALATTAPAMASTEADVLAFIALIKQGGTDVVHMSNREAKGFCIGKAGAYLLDEKTNVDALVICSDQVDLNDSNEVWEVLAHEGTHVMQACVADGTGTMFKPQFVPTMLREVRAFAPHYHELVTSKYTSDFATVELEAFWMELQEPAAVMAQFKTVCGRFLK